MTVTRPIIASRTVNEASLRANFVNTSRKIAFSNNKRAVNSVGMHTALNHNETRPGNRLRNRVSIEFPIPRFIPYFIVSLRGQRSLHTLTRYSFAETNLLKLFFHFSSPPSGEQFQLAYIYIYTRIILEIEINRFVAKSPNDLFTLF